VAQQNINEVRASRADFAAARAGLMFQTQPMFLDLEELLVLSERFGRASRATRRKLCFRVSEDLVVMRPHRDCRS
jgi:hypothetical protein